MVYSMTRLLFTTDPHGSTNFLLKCITMINRHNPDIAIISGDLTAKGIIPIIHENDGTYTSMFKKSHKIKKETDLEKELYEIEKIGLYAYICDREQKAKLEDKNELVKVFDNLAIKSIEKWISLIENKIGDKIKKGNIKLVMMPGNDDSLEIDKILEKSNLVVYPLKKVVAIDEYHKMISFEYANPTPWNTPREADEEKIAKALDNIFKEVSDYEHLVFLCHCPPYDSGLDLAPKLDEKLTPIYVLGQPLMEPVGSKAIRNIIEKYQPKLGLFGHIHEAYGFVKIGRTLCINPGSEYDRGLFRGYVIDISKDKVEKFWRVEG